MRNFLRRWLGINDIAETMATHENLNDRCGAIELAVGTSRQRRLQNPVCIANQLEAVDKRCTEIEAIDGNQPISPVADWQKTKLGGAIRDLQGRVSVIEPKPRPKANKGR